MEPLILPLAECTGVPVEVIGGKAAGLARALAEGFPVPETLCLTAPALAAHLDRAGADPRDTARCLDAVERRLHQDLLGELSDACRGLLSGSGVAVRSSAPVEDSERASWAGQFTSVLGVGSIAALEEAIRECWRSAFTGQATAYAETGGRMAVLIQRLVRARCAGVAFSVDPRTGREAVAVVEAVPGLGTALVDGRATPDRFEIDTEAERISSRESGEHRIAVRASGGVLVEEAASPASVEEATALRAAMLARDLQERFGLPVDVEWALAEGDSDVTLLQVRPLTAIAFRPWPGVWTSANFVEVMPGIVTSLTASLSLEEDYPSVLQEFGCEIGLAKAGDPMTEGRRICGRAYWRADRIKESLARLPGFRERRFDEGVGIRPTYEGDGRTTGFTPASIARGLPVLVRLGRLFKAEHEAAAAELRSFGEVEARVLARDHDALGDPDLAEAVAGAIEARRKVNRRAMRATFLADLAQDDLRAVLAKTARRLDPPPSEAALVTGLGDLATGKALKELEALAAELRGAPEIAAALIEASSPAGVRPALERAAGGSNVLARIERLVSDYGYMADADEELALPRWDEDPSVPLAALQAVLRAPQTPPPARSNFEAERARVRAALPRLSRRGFDQKLDRARLYSFWREETRQGLARANRLCRITALACGRRLAARGSLERADDVFRLTHQQLCALAAGEMPPAEARAAVSSSRRVEASWANFRPPDVLGVEQGAEEEPPGDGLHGVPCSPGIAEGPVAVVRDLAELGKVNAGDVLVVPFTNPGWTPAFALASALVTEEGGLLSHGSIVARERGLPAVLRVHHATERLRDGERVRVDGTRGIVTKLDR